MLETATSTLPLCLALLVMKLKEAGFCWLDTRGAVHFVAIGAQLLHCNELAPTPTM